MSFADLSRKNKELFFVHAAKARYSFAADPMGKYGATPREYAGHHQLENWFEMTEWGTFFCHPEPGRRLVRDLFHKNVLEEALVGG